MSLKLTIIEMIKIWQDRRGFSNEDMAKIIGIQTQNFTRRMKQGTITIAELEKILERLGCECEIIESKITEFRKV